MKLLSHFHFNQLFVLPLPLCKGELVEGLHCFLILWENVFSMVNEKIQCHQGIISC